CTAKHLMKKCGSVGNSSGSFPAFSCRLCRNEFPGHEEQVFQRIAANAGQPHEYGWVAYIVICYVVCVGGTGDQFIPVIDTHPNYETIRLGRLVDRYTSQELPSNFQARGSVDGPVLNLRQRKSNFAYCIKVDHDLGGCIHMACTRAYPR